VQKSSGRHGLTYNLAQFVASDCIAERAAKRADVYDPGTTDAEETAVNAGSGEGAARG